MTSLTSRQSDALAFIARFKAERGLAPTYREIGKAMGLAGIGGVHRLVTGLEERGAIRRLPDRARSIEVVDEGEQSAEFHLRAVLSAFSPGGILFLENGAVQAAVQFLNRRTA